MKRVVLIIPDLQKGGPQSALIPIINRLSVENSVSILTRRDTSIDYEIDSRVTIYMALGGGRFPFVSMLMHLLKHRYDTHLVTLDYITLVGLLKIVLPKSRFVVRPANHISENFEELIDHRGEIFTFYRRAYLYSISKSDLIVAQSTEIQEDLLLRYNMPTYKVVRIGNALPKKVHLRQRANKDKIKLVSVGRLSRQKGYDIAIRAVKILSDKGFNLDLDIYGEGIERDSLSKLIESLGLCDKINLCGFAQIDSKLFSQYDIFLSPSRYEGFPNAVMESISNGLPIVACPYPGGIRDIFDFNVGVISDAIAPEQLSDAILTAHYSWDSIICDSFCEIESKFSLKSITQEYQQIL